jgi:hypothetical protein
VAPLLFLIFHAYLLLNLRLLVDNVTRFNQMLEAAKLTPEEQDSFRLLLSNFPFVQLLAGTRDSKRGMVGWVLAVIVWIHHRLRTGCAVTDNPAQIPSLSP